MVGTSLTRLPCVFCHQGGVAAPALALSHKEIVLTAPLIKGSSEGKGQLIDYAKFSRW